MICVMQQFINLVFIRIEIGVVMSAIRVLIIDDSVVVRRFLSDLLACEPDMEPAGIAPNGRIGLAKITQTMPDLVLLDLEMPEMDGLETLGGDPPAVAAAAGDHVQLADSAGSPGHPGRPGDGANDYVTKPKQMGSPEEAVQCVRGDLDSQDQGARQASPSDDHRQGDPPPSMATLAAAYRPGGLLGRGA